VKHPFSKPHRHRRPNHAGRTPARPPAAPLLPARKQAGNRFVEGTLQLKGRVGFVLSDQPDLSDVLIDGPSLALAMDGDRVSAEVTSSPQAPRRSGRLLKVLEHARDTVVGSFGRVNGSPVVLLENSLQPIRLLQLHHFHPGDGELVVARITQWPGAKTTATAELTDVLGPRSKPGVELQAVIHKYNLSDVFPLEVEREAGVFGETVLPDAYAGRETLFHQRIFTIDGADAKDFDDAVSIESLPHGGWRLGVHIADVSHYVRENSVLDEEAYRRGTSVYLSGTVLPMLPFSLSDGLCSLRPEQIRLTLSCEMDLTTEGTVSSHRIFESAIRSVRRFTYEQVEQILKGETLPGLPSAIHGDIREMSHLARLIRRQRTTRGSLDFDFPEPDVKTDPHGRPLDIRRRERLESHRLIEDFMILANEAVARHMSRGPFLYRIHEAPDPQKLVKLRQSLELIGLRFPRGFGTDDPRTLQHLLQAAEGKPTQPMVHMMVLRSLKQAVYSTTHAGHFGLASSCYTHFTSPIRRYPDLIVHRLIKERLHHFTTDRQTRWKPLLAKIAPHASQRERVAVDAEREYLDVQKVRLMEPHVGESFSGVISSVTAFGIFVQLKEFFVEGLVHISNLQGDYYLFDEVRLQLRGKRTGRIFQMGQSVRIQLAAANPVKRQLDFDLLPSDPPRKK
jgi:ribonuclease R